MIMFSLNPASRTLPPVEMMGSEATEIIGRMLEDGVKIQAVTFPDREGGAVTAMWSEDTAGRVATVWEHDYFWLTAEAITDSLIVREVTGTHAS